MLAANFLLKATLVMIHLAKICRTNPVDDDSNITCRDCQEFTDLPNSILNFSDCQTDFVFIVDSTPVLRETDLSFLADFIHAVDNSTGESQFGLVTFGTTAKNEFFLNTYSDTETVASTLRRTMFARIKFSLNESLRTARLHQFHKGNGTRPNATKAAIVMVCSELKNFHETVLEVRQLKQMNVHVVLVGFGDGFKRADLLNITSDGRRVFQIQPEDSYNYQKSAADIMNTSCQRGYKTTHNRACDILLIADFYGSGSAGILDKLVVFLSYMVKLSDVGPKTVQFGLVAVPFDTTPKSEFHLNTYAEKEPLLRAIGSMTFVENTSKMHEGIRLGSTDQFSSRNGARLTSNKVALIMGRTLTESVDNTVAEICRLMSMDVDVILACTGDDISMHQLIGDSSSIDLSFHISTTDDLASSVPMLLKTICEKDATANGIQIGEDDTFEDDAEPGEQIPCNSMTKTSCTETAKEHTESVNNSTHQLVAKREIDYCQKVELLHFNSSENICCDGVKRPKKYGERTGCCGTSIFDKRYTICCNGNLQPGYGHRGRRGRCCGTMSFDHRCSRCTHNKYILPKFNTKLEICCDGRIMSKKGIVYAACCELEVYDLFKKTCCNATVWEKYVDNMNRSCCGRSIYDVLQYKCIGGTLHPLVESFDEEPGTERPLDLSVVDDEQSTENDPLYIIYIVVPVVAVVALLSLLCALFLYKRKCKKRQVRSDLISNNIGARLCSHENVFSDQQNESTADEHSCPLLSNSQNTPAVKTLDSTIKTLSPDSASFENTFDSGTREFSTSIITFDPPEVFPALPRVDTSASDDFDNFARARNVSHEQTCKSKKQRNEAFRNKEMEKNTTTDRMLECNDTAVLGDCDNKQKPTLRTEDLEQMNKDVSKISSNAGFQHPFLDMSDGNHAVRSRPNLNNGISLISTDCASECESTGSSISIDMILGECASNYSSEGTFCSENTLRVSDNTSSRTTLEQTSGDNITGSTCSPIDMCVVNTTGSPTETFEVSKIWKVDEKNITLNLFSEASTQTGPEKGINRRNVFGVDWQFNKMFTSEGGTLQKEKSEVQFIVPPNAVKAGSFVHVFGSIYLSLTMMRMKFNIKSDEEIVTPGVEYIMVGSDALEAYAVVKIPIAGTAEGLNVYSFPSDSGRGAIISLKRVPPRTKENNVIQSIFYVVGKDGVVYIFAKHFCGFVCTRCASNEPIRSLRPMVFGSYCTLGFNQRVATIRMIIADHRARTLDFRQGLIDEESQNGRQYLGTDELLLEKECKKEHVLQVTLDIDGTEQWTFKYCTAVQSLTMQDVSPCCRRNRPAEFGSDFAMFTWEVESTEMASPNSNYPDRFRCRAVFAGGNLQSQQISACRPATIQTKLLPLETNQETKNAVASNIEGILSNMDDSDLSAIGLVRQSANEAGVSSMHASAGRNFGSIRRELPDQETLQPDSDSGGPQAGNFTRPPVQVHSEPEESI